MVSSACFKNTPAIAKHGIMKQAEETIPQNYEISVNFTLITRERQESGLDMKGNEKKLVLYSLAML